MSKTGSRWVEWLPYSLRSKIAFRPSLQAILENTSWLVFDKVFRLAVGGLIGIWVARHFGPSSFGVLNYAISFAMIFGSVASLGLDSIVVRGIIQEKDNKNRLLGTAGVMRVVSGMAVVLSASIAAFYAPSSNTETVTLVVWIALGYLAQSLDIIDYWFQANITSRYSVIARNVAFLIVSALKIVALLKGVPIVFFAILATTEILIASLGLLIAYNVSGEHIRRWRFDRRLARQMLKDGWPLTLSGLVIIVYMRVDQVLLGSMMGPAAVGVYAAAVRLVEIWYFVPGAVVVSVLPSILKARQENPYLYKRRLQQLYDLMAMLSILIASVVSIFSRNIIGILYGAPYRAAPGILTIYIWSGVPTFLGVASSQYLVAENFTRISLYRTAIGMVLNIILNIILIPSYGLTGSAIATLISYTFATFLVVLFNDSRDQTWMMLKSLNLIRGVKNIFSAAGSID